MECPDEQAGQPAKAPPPLDYVRPLHYMEPLGDVLERRARRVAVVTGAVVSGLAVFGGVFFFIIASLNLGAGPPPPERYRDALWMPGILAITVALVTAYQHFIRKRRGFLAGVLIGIGVAAMIEGACFAALR